jgi:hypothetical protein
VEHSKEVIITQVKFTHTLDNGAGFAVRTDNMEDCYVPKKVASMVKPEIGNVYTAKVVDNPFGDSRNRTPWMLTYMQEQPPLAVVPDSRKPIYDRVCDTLMFGGVWTGRTIAENLLNSPTEDIVVSCRTALEKAHREGIASKVSFFKTHGQERSSRDYFHAVNTLVKVVAE